MDMTIRTMRYIRYKIVRREESGIVFANGIGAEQK
jgi:hypothetical protein